jgi:hypothetical protein
MAETARMLLHVIVVSVAMAVVGVILRPLA